MAKLLILAGILGLALASPTKIVARDTLSSCAADLNGVLPSPTPSGFHFSGNVRTYYVAADEVLWDYAPTGWDNWLGVPLTESPRANFAGVNQFGTKWLKALYRGYTDSTFTAQTEQPPWQGTQGPTLRAEVGDLIQIMFVNNLTTYYATMHSMGLAYTKYNEGGDYPNNTAPGQPNQLPETEAVPPVQPGVAPGGCVVYKWFVDDIAGPNDGEPARVHSYHSYVALEQDTEAGLIGPSIVYAPGMMKSTMANYREIPLLYMIYSEAISWLSGANAALLGGGAGVGGGFGPSSSVGSGSGSSSSASSPSAGASSSPPTVPYATSSGFAAPTDGQPFGRPGSWSPHGRPPSSHGKRQAPASGPSSFVFPPYNSLPSGNESVWLPQLVNLAGSFQFPEAPSFYTMNGYVFANNPTFEMCLDDNVIWYVNAYGSMSHVFHMHGNSFYYQAHKHYAMSINDGEGKTLYMNATGAGKWQVICHVGWHQTTGMESNYQVYYAGQCPLPPLGS